MPKKLTEQEKRALIKDKKLHGADASVYPKFLVALLLGVPIFLVVKVPIVIVYMIYKKFLKPKKKRVPPTYLEVKEVAKDLKAPETRPYELVMFGATGFTGQLTVQYLAENYPNLKWAIAGRSQQRLEKVREKLAKIDDKLKNLPILIADSSNVEQLTSVVRETRTVISTVGPFARYGTNLVALCAKYGTNYADITGEVAWVRQMIEQYDNIAAKSGAKIISCCGFDSIPWDLLTLSIFNKMKKSHNQNLKRVDHYDYIRGGMSGGTFTTLQYSMANPPPKSKLGFDPLIKKIGENEKSTHKFRSVIQRFLGYNGVIKSFVGMWGLADGNAGIVKRSNALLNYGEQFTYSEAMVYPNFFAGFVQQVFFLYMGALLAVPPLLKLVEPYIFPMPGQGPSEQEQRDGFCIIKARGTGVDGAKVRGEIMYPNEPGYKDTARMIAETGLALSLNHNELKVKGGFWTPASGLGDVLIKRLVDSGCSVQIE